MKSPVISLWCKPPEIMHGMACVLIVVQEPSLPQLRRDVLWMTSAGGESLRKKAPRNSALLGVTFNFRLVIKSLIIIIFNFFLCLLRNQN